MNPTDFLSGPVADALGWTLLHALWQGFALVLPTAVVLHLLRGRSSNRRYQVGVLALLTQLLLSVTTFAWYYQPTVTILDVSVHPALVQSWPIRWQAMTQTLPWPQQVGQFLQIHLGQFVLIYLLGVVLFGLRLAGGWLYLQRLSRTATQPATMRWTELTDALRSALGVRAVVRVRESARIMVPMVVGVLKPVLLLPIGLAANLSMREVEAVLAHELAHVKRHDYAVNLLQSVMEVLFFFHPALWWLSARVREEREHCCDDLAVRAIGGDGRILAQALARVEELRLTQAPARPAPALAMAFATKRQQLLHRVRRMLGVPTRPFVSNSSLAGLTLTTVLLVSVSVYAVQQREQPTPKPRTTQPQPTRRHKVDDNSEYGMAGDKRVSYVIWKGQKLPASRVTRLQRQLDQVMAGQLSLDAVKQPDRDILLTIIEKNNAFDSGMDGLTAGLAQLDYNTIIKTGLDAANAAGTFPVNVDSILKTVEKADYNRVIGDAMARVDTNIFFQDGDLVRSGNAGVVTRYHQRQMDSLSRLMAQRSQQMQALQLQMEKLRFPVEEAERSREVLEWRKNKLMDQRNALIEKHQRLLQNDGKLKLSQADVEKQLDALQPEIKKQETGIEEMNQQLEAMQSQLETARQPLEKLEQEVQQINTQMDALSDQMSRQQDDAGGLMNLNHALNLNLNRNLNVNLNKDLNIQRLQMDRQRRKMEMNFNQLQRESVRRYNQAATIRPARPPQPPKPANAVRPALPPAPATPVLAPTPKPAVAPTPKVAPAPRPK